MPCLTECQKFKCQRCTHGRRHSPSGAKARQWSGIAAPTSSHLMPCPDMEPPPAQAAGCQWTSQQPSFGPDKKKTKHICKESQGSYKTVISYPQAVGI